MQQNDDELSEEFPLSYSIDNAILMHRDVHFGGDFDTMLDYYRKGGKGVNNEFEISRIEELQRTEKNAGKNLSPIMLSGAEAEKVAQVRKMYQDLRNLYNHPSKNRLPILIADLILSEEEDVAKAIEAIVAEKGTIVPSLIEILRNENLYDPLFPGYGEAPLLAAKSLGMIGDKRAIIFLFESVGEGDFFHENYIFDALRSIGKPAKDFLLHVLHGHPLNYDNEKAAIALLGFKDDPEVSSACLKILKEIDPHAYESLATYLVLACESLSPQEQKELLAIAEDPKTPKTLRQDIAAVAKTWLNP